VSPFDRDSRMRPRASVRMAGPSKKKPASEFIALLPLKRPQNGCHSSFPSNLPDTSCVGSERGLGCRRCGVFVPPQHRKLTHKSRSPHPVWSFLASYCFLLGEVLPVMNPCEFPCRQTRSSLLPDFQFTGSPGPLESGKTIAPSGTLASQIPHYVSCIVTLKDCIQRTQRFCRFRAHEHEPKKNFFPLPKTPPPPPPPCFYRAASSLIPFSFPLFSKPLPLLVNLRVSQSHPRAGSLNSSGVNPCVVG